MALVDCTVIVHPNDAVVSPAAAATVQVLGAAGIRGPKGDPVNPSDYFQTALKFAELDTPQKKADARTNLELQYIDCGTFN